MQHPVVLQPSEQLLPLLLGPIAQQNLPGPAQPDRLLHEIPRGRRQRRQRRAQPAPGQAHAHGGGGGDTSGCDQPISGGGGTSGWRQPISGAVCAGPRVNIPRSSGTKSDPDPIFHLRAVAAILPPPFCLLRAEHRAAPKGKRSDFWGKFRRFSVFWTPIPLERDFLGVFRSDLGSFFGEKRAFSGFCGQKKRCPPPPSLSAMGPPRPLMNINDLEGSALELVNIDSPHEY